MIWLSIPSCGQFLETQAEMNVFYFQMSDKDMNRIILALPTEWGWGSCCSKSI